MLVSEDAVRLGEARSRALLVDNDTAILRRWERVLAPEVEVIQAHSLDAAWQATEAALWKTTPCDFVLLELGLADGDGADLLPRLARLEPPPAVAVISGQLTAARFLSLRGRCAIVLTKPVETDILFDVLRLLEEQRAGDQTVTDFAEHYRFSAQETKLLRAALRELSNEMAAELLGCAHSTVRSYWVRIFRKSGCANERDVIARLFEFARTRSHSSSRQEGKSGTYRRHRPR